MENEIIDPEIIDNPYYIRHLVEESKYPNHDKHTDVQWLEKGSAPYHTPVIIFYEVKHHSFNDSILGEYSTKEIASALLDTSDFGKQCYREYYDKGELIDATKKEE